MSLMFSYLGFEVKKKSMYAKDHIYAHLRPKIYWAQPVQSPDSVH